MISIHDGEMTAMFAEIIDNNRAGGSRRIKAERGEA